MLSDVKHHWGVGKAALSFCADQIRTLVSMATDSSRIKGRHHVFSTLFDSFLYLQVTMTCKRASMSLKFGQIRSDHRLRS